MPSTRRDLLGRIPALCSIGLSGAIAGCSGQGPGSTPTATAPDEPMTESPSPTPSPTPTATPSPTPTAELTVRDHSTYDEILADSSGRTLYVFARDSEGETVCYDDCAQAWPPLTVPRETAVRAGSAVSAAVDAIERDGGRLQVTVDGLPVYYFANDSDPGDATGMGLGNAWWLVRPDGSVLQPTVSMADHETVGSILTDGDGRTLYMFEPDSSGESACTGDCAEAWPPLTVERETTLYPAATVAASLGTIERSDGSLQVTANGHPLYYFVNDDGPGDATGQGVNAVWFVLRPDGTVYRSQTPTPTPTPTATPSQSDDDDDDGGGAY